MKMTNKEEKSLLIDMCEIKASTLKDHISKHKPRTRSRMSSLSNRLREIFPTKWLFCFFVIYTLLYIIGAILVKFSTNDYQHDKNTNSSSSSSSSYSYDTVSVVLSTELLKLILNTVIFLMNGGNLLSYGRSIVRHRIMALYYLIPSGLYGLYNNLTFVSLSIMDPATYYILLQFRIAVTALIYQAIFKRDLSRIQWLSLVLLTLGCIIKQWPTSSNIAGSLSVNHFSLVIIAIQIFCSCFAGVYNEFLLKNKQDNIAQVDLFVQNVYMYVDSIFVNMIAVFGRHLYDNSSTLTIDFSIFTKPLVIAIMLTSALCGLSTSYFIKAFNSIMKSYATSLELLLTAIICWLLFSIPVTIPTIISICVVSYATYLFAKHPVISK